MVTCRVMQVAMSVIAMYKTVFPHTGTGNTDNLMLMVVLIGQKASCTCVLILRYHRVT